ncbi:hypothetical protein M3147_01190 [Agromyces mediolanus]|uniref:hypothetical protein n=1 Tax=Agromyces mediolanus TaxID=41986 RepID=UPI00203D02B4|nr:hypothetical protein [Agromyces mediolanus]MCM3655862.1 hypothetical protein [Agromyces mediolanus]
MSGSGPGPEGQREGPADERGEAADAPRQRVVRARGARRAKLTPAPGSDPAPESPVERGRSGAKSPDDERITRERPPHW